jgi:predicted DNA-binding transcriptional regulator YafY
MKTLTQLKRLQKIHQLIKTSHTGTPKEFANIIGVSRSQLFNILDDLKLKGFPISYSRSLKSYIYHCDCELEIEYSVRLLTEHKEIKIDGNEK